MTDKQYILELEKALIFLCEVYEDAKEAVGCREGDNITADKKYTDLWFHFPIIQSDAGHAVRMIAELRTARGNREASKVSMFDLFERMHKGRKTKTEFSNEVREIVKKHKHA